MSRPLAATAPRRIQLRRTKGWVLPTNTVVASRPTRWGNPFVEGATSHLGVSFSAGPLTRRQAIELFRGSIEAQLRDFPDSLAELRGKNLACWCALNEPCHADILLELANADGATP